VRTQRSAVGVRVRRLDGRADHSDAFGPEDLVEGVAELRVSIMDQKSGGLVVAELHGQVACLLGDPAPVRIRGGGDVLDPSRRERDEEQHVDPLQEGGLDGEEVAREDVGRLGSQNARHDERLRCGAG
jgi:hypothetical protein